MSGRDVEAEFSDFFYGAFVPSILAFVGWWVVFRLLLNDALTSAGFPPITVGSDGAVGFARFALLVALTAVVGVVAFVGYARLIRDR